jgi:hypothetical protein
MKPDEKLRLKKYVYEMLGSGKGYTTGYLEDCMENRTLTTCNSIEFAPHPPPSKKGYSSYMIVSIPFLDSLWKELSWARS